jgi:hypothetical protein
MRNVTMNKTGDGRVVDLAKVSIVIFDIAAGARPRVQVWRRVGETLGNGREEEERSVVSAVPEAGLHSLTIAFQDLKPPNTFEEDF